MIEIKESKTADTRTCDVTKVTKEQLKQSSAQHIGDVTNGIFFFVRMLCDAALFHDFDKVSDEGLDAFYKDFKRNFETTDWWDNHRRVNRHHLLQADGVPDDVNLIDVIEMIVDCVMAGMARSGDVYPLDIDLKVLQKAFENTAKLLKENVTVI